MLSILFKSHLIRHSGSRRASKGHSEGTRTFNALGAHSYTWALGEHSSGTQELGGNLEGTQALGGHFGTRTLKEFGHLDTQALGHLENLGTWRVGHSEHWGTRGTSFSRFFFWLCF